MLKIALWVFGLALATCAALFEPNGLIRFTPPDHYREIWDSAEACTGAHGNFNHVVWYVLPGNSFPAPTGTAIGYWQRPNRIYLAHDWLGTDWVIKHEMIHDLIHMGHSGTVADTILWGIRCHAMWGYQPGSNNPNYRP